jgi:formylglycine-generating enzyme
MAWPKTILLVTLAVYALAIVAMALGAEPLTPKPEAQNPVAPAPSPAPVPPKPHIQESEPKPPGKAIMEGTGKEPASSSAPTPAKPPAKSAPASNGVSPQKAPVIAQPPSEIIGKDGAPMVLIPVGEFTMGSDKGDDDEEPVHRVFLDSFYLDKFEVTNGRFAKFVEAVQSEPPWGFADKETPVLRQDQPVRWVNWMEAMGYCLWAGKRLPTEAEWEKAARGSDARIYPWGNDPPTLAHAVFGLKEGSDTVSAIGNRDKGKSPYGVHDLAGNLYEWTTDWYDEQFYRKNPAINPRGPAEGSAKVQRGGSYINGAYRLRSSFRTKGDPTEHDPNVGFRCALDVPKQP